MIELFYQNFIRLSDWFYYNFIDVLPWTRIELHNWTTKELTQTDPDNFPPQNPYACGVYEMENHFNTLIENGEL